jgi:leader peptidase (prepilin peptidase) / N-methyltransferase
MFQNIILSMNIPLIVLAALIGLACGWIVNYLSDVLPATRRLSHPQCKHCNSPLPWLDYLLLKRCPGCHATRSIRSWVIQVLFPVLSVLIWIYPRPILSYPVAMLLLVFFALVIVMDLEHRVVLHPVSLSGIILGLGVGMYLRGDTSIANGIISTLLGGAAGFGFMLVFYFIGKLYVRWMAKRKGLPPDEVALGFGDVNLAGVLGLMLGWPAIAACLFFAILAGGIISLLIVVGMLVAKRYQAFTAIPYAPFLILAAIYLLFS